MQRCIAIPAGGVLSHGRDLMQYFQPNCPRLFCSLAPGAKLTLLGHGEIPTIVVEFKTCSLRTRKELQCLMRKINYVQQRMQGGNVSAKSSARGLLLCQVHGFNADA